MNTQREIYAGTAGHSVWFSDDLGLNWVHPNSQSGMYLETRVWAMTSHPELQQHLFAGTDDGVYRWNEAPARWTKLASPMTDVWAIAQDPHDPQMLLAGTRPAALYRSRDGGTTWDELSVPGISKFSEVNMGPTRVTQILFDPLDKDTVWATIEIGGIYRSDDGGTSWISMSEGLVSSDVHGIAVTRDKKGLKRLLASTNRGLHTSTDNGARWQFQSLDSPWQYTRAVVVRPDDPSIVFLANGNGPPGDQGRLLRSLVGQFNTPSIRSMKVRALSLQGPHQLRLGLEEAELSIVVDHKASTNRRLKWLTKIPDLRLPSLWTSMLRRPLIFSRLFTTPRTFPIF